MNIGILGYGKVSNALIDIIDKEKDKIFVWHMGHQIPREKYVKKFWGEDIPHEIVQKNMINVVVDAIGDNDEGITKSKWAIEKSLKNDKFVITCNKKLMDQHGTELCNYAKKYNKFYINPIVAYSPDYNGLGHYLDINNFELFSKEELFAYRGAGPKETALFIYEEINRIRGLI